jgi:hypothetical protein
MKRALILLLLCPLLVSAQIQHKEKANDGQKTEQAETAKPKSAVKPDSLSKEEKSQSKTPDCKDSRQDGIYRVVVVRQPFDWTALASVIIAVLSLGLVYKQVQAIRNSERALIVCNVESSALIKPPGPNEIFHCIVAVKNTGRTPAVVTEAAVSAKLTNSLSDLPKPPEYGDKERLSSGQLLLVSEDSFPLTCQTKMETAQYWEIKQGTRFLYVHGFVRYRDTYGRRHETRFCDYYHVSDGVQPLVEGFQKNIAAPLEYNKAT